MKPLIIITILTIIESRELNLHCPFSKGPARAISRDGFFLKETKYPLLKKLSIQTTCSITVSDVTTSLETYRVFREIESQNPYIIHEEVDLDVITGFCAWETDITQDVLDGKLVLCLDVACNSTDDCKVLLNVMVRQAMCQTLRSCSVTLLGQKHTLNFLKTNCPTGVQVDDKCFDPLLAKSRSPLLQSHATLPVACYANPADTHQRALFEMIGRFITGLEDNHCKSNQGRLRYSCVVGDNSELIVLNDDRNLIQQRILAQMMKNPLGRPFYSKTEQATIQVMGHKYNITIGKHGKVTPSPGTSDYFFRQILFAYYSSPSFTSLYRSTKVSGDNYDNFILKGLIPEMEIHGCFDALLPQVWFDFVNVPGTYRTFQQCRIFCTLAGPGASCEVFAPGGIYNLSTTQCFIPTNYKFKGEEEILQFSCPRIDTDLMFYCNGHRTIIRTRTLMIGQCIYVVSSYLSILPSIAHSLAVEICVPGFHGWMTIICLITFCFGWLLIPLVTKCVLSILLQLTKLKACRAKLALASVLDKIKVEYQHTLGNTTCETCGLQTNFPEEFNAHSQACPMGICPYCSREIGLMKTSSVLHFEKCSKADRFSKKYESVITPVTTTTKLTRGLTTFRYQNRCYIGIVWLILLLIELSIWAATAQNTDLAHGVGKLTLNNALQLQFSIPGNVKYVYKRELLRDEKDKEGIPFTFTLDPGRTTATVIELGTWMDVEVNLQTIFHCYGSCSAYTYPWYKSTCKREHGFQYETSWSCNPASCPGVNTGCTMCALYTHHLKDKGPAVKVLQLTIHRSFCYQLGAIKVCDTLTEADCYTDDHLKFCLNDHKADIFQGDVLFFNHQWQDSAVVFKQWCTSNCVFGDPGDIISSPTGISCPQFDGSFQKQCKFGTTPSCLFTGNMVSGYKKYWKTRDLFRTVNMTDIKHTSGELEWVDTSGHARSMIDIEFSASLPFEELSQTKCKISLKAIGVQGSWGGGQGFTISCIVDLIQCSEFITAIKVCDSSSCYGVSSATLARGENEVKVTGRGGHSGSKFMCCHDHNCSQSSYPASPPHLERLQGITEDVGQLYDDGKRGCGITCWLSRSWEWVKGLFSGNFFLPLILIGIALFSIILLSFLLPARRRT
ncbi:glycoprotein [Hainan oriental leaf-toed gecko hantavirus]|uniref:Envelopment polyprotein n=1 Tax=Hainan oriental leaf-toed gecko hantavirus TaxID=2116437 RepID=A0A2P1GNW7_9VIRU|nr:glycoprotein [Hainan oriental leaf-toed gecko hantavirus]